MARNVINQNEINIKINMVRRKNRCTISFLDYNEMVHSSVYKRRKVNVVCIYYQRRRTRRHTDRKLRIEYDDNVIAKYDVDTQLQGVDQ